MKKIIFSLFILLCVGSTGAWSQNTSQANLVELPLVYLLDGINTGYKEYFYPWQGCQTQLIHFKARQSPDVCKLDLQRALTKIENLGWIRVDIMTERDSDSPNERFACQGWMRFTLLANTSGNVRNVILNPQHTRAQLVLYQNMRYPWE